MRRLLRLSLLAALLAGPPPGWLTGSPVDAATPAEPPAPSPLCATADPRLTELSGLATDGGSGRWAVPDGGRQVRIYQLAADCAVRAVLTSAVDPSDVEDLARAPDGTFWLADTGDNALARRSVAVITLAPGGATAVYRLRYPDGPHDAEALLLGRDGVPLVVTKELGSAGVYRPERPLPPGGTGGEPIALRRVAE